jgi:hypothetical protein
VVGSHIVGRRIVTATVIDTCGHLACPVAQWPTVTAAARWLRIPAAEVRGEIRAGRLGVAVLDGVTRVNPLTMSLLLRDRPPAGANPGGNPGAAVRRAVRRLMMMGAAAGARWWRHAVE